MSGRYIFHLSMPVLDLHASRQFYVETLGARVGRENPEWLDVLLWGHQITLQLAPNEVLPNQETGHRHFGVVLPWEKWEALSKRLEAAGVSFLKSPTVLKAGTENEQAKFYLKDPSGNVIEIKAYRDFSTVLALSDRSYSYSD